MEFHKLSVHSIVDTCCKTFIIRTCTFKSSFLVKIVQCHIISIVCTTTGKIYIMILADTCLEYFFKPICIGVILKTVFTCSTVKMISSRNRSIRINTCLTDILTVLVCIHYIIYIVRNIIDTKISVIIYFQRLVFLSTFCSNDNHTISSTGTINSSSRGILQHLNCFYIIRREITYGSSHRNTVNYIKRSSTSERTDTTDTN